MKHRWSLVLLKITMLTMLIFSLGGVFSSQIARASTCNSQSALSVCAFGTGSVSVVRPTLTCSLGGSGGESIDIMQGCNGSNWEKIGFSNFDGLQQYVQRYGWTYSGTGDGYRYFTFNNYTYFQPDDTSTWAISYSDGNEVGNSCDGGGSCNYNAWQNGEFSYYSPTAQLRDWVITSRASSAQDEENRALEYPQPGISNCVGSQEGTSATYGFTAEYSVQGGKVGINTGNTLNYALDGQCNDGAPDAYSSYMNLNWGGVTCRGPVCSPNTTESPLSYLNVTSTDGKNGANGNIIGLGMNMTVNWYNESEGDVLNVDLHGSLGYGPNYNFAQETWSY